MKTLLWLIGGIAMVAATFFVQPRAPELWTALDAAMVSAGSCLCLLLVYTLVAPLRLRERVVIVLTAAAAVLAVIGGSRETHETASYQRERLAKIRTVIGRGIIERAGQDSLLTVLERYYTTGARHPATIKAAFLDMYPGAAPGLRTIAPQYEGDTIQVRFIQALDEDRVVILWEEKVARGRDTGFVNCDGRRGRVQEKFTLTAKGVQHEWQN